MRPWIAAEFVPGSHLLYVGDAYAFYAMGRVMGQTTESTPRTIVYVEEWPMVPVVAKISGNYSTTYGGVYYGRIVQGQFSNSQNSYAFPMAGYANSGTPSTDTTWIVNNWEQTYRPNSGSNALAAGTYVWGLMTGFPIGAFPNGSATSDTWYMVHTWFPPQSAAVTFQLTQTFETANTSYGTNEQAMMNNLKSDVVNLRTELLALYANLKAAGYSL
jgi:hypothetical protein